MHIQCSITQRQTGVGVLVIITIPRTFAIAIVRVLSIYPSIHPFIYPSVRRFVRAFGIQACNNTVNDNIVRQSGEQACKMRALEGWRGKNVTDESAEETDGAIY